MSELPHEVVGLHLINGSKAESWTSLGVVVLPSAGKQDLKVTEIRQYIEAQIVACPTQYTICTRQGWVITDAQEKSVTFPQILTDDGTIQIKRKYDHPKLGIRTRNGEVIGFVHVSYSSNLKSIKQLIYQQVLQPLGFPKVFHFLDGNSWQISSVQEHLMTVVDVMIGSCVSVDVSSKRRMSQEFSPPKLPPDKKFREAKQLSFRSGKDIYRPPTIDMISTSSRSKQVLISYVRAEAASHALSLKEELSALGLSVYLKFVWVKGCQGVPANVMWPGRVIHSEGEYITVYIRSDNAELKVKKANTFAFASSSVETHWDKFQGILHKKKRFSSLKKRKKDIDWIKEEVENGDIADTYCKSAVADTNCKSAVADTNCKSAVADTNCASADADANCASVDADANCENVVADTYFESAIADTNCDVHEIKTGVDWQDSLNFAVSGCEVFVPLVTLKYGLTQWTNREVKLADVLGKYILPVNFLLEWPPRCLAIQFASTQFIPWIPPDDLKVTQFKEINDKSRGNRLVGPITFWRISMGDEQGNLLDLSSGPLNMSHLKLVANQIADRVNGLRPDSVPSLMKRATIVKSCAMVTQTNSMATMADREGKPLVVICLHPSEQQHGVDLSVVLEKEGFEVWCTTELDRKHLDIIDGLASSQEGESYLVSLGQGCYGEEGKQSIQVFQEMADDASVVLCVLSEAFSQSRTCQQQVFYCEHRKRIVHIMYEDFQMPEWMAMLIGSQGFQLRRDEDYMDLVIRKVRAVTDHSCRETNGASQSPTFPDCDNILTTTQRKSESSQGSPTTKFPGTDSPVKRPSLSTMKTVIL